MAGKSTSGAPGKKKPMKLDIKEGTMRSAFGVKEGQKVNPADENKVLNADTGDKVKLSTGKTVTATAGLKKKANLSKNMRTWK